MRDANAPRESAIINNPIPTRYHNKVALAQLAFEGLVSLPNAHTKSIMKPTIGIEAMSIVMNQSVVEIGLGFWSMISI
tara:strand:+ start:3273 stop:3506 length:234 start_codon:yes stop_codon:yes gene_type:complete